VKFPYPTLARLMSGRSAIVEPGDGEMTVPPVLQPTLDIFSPLLAPGVLTVGPANDTWMTGLDTVIAGVNAADFFRNYVTFKAGRWELNIDFQFLFHGSANYNNDSGFDLVDPLGNFAQLFSFTHASTAASPVTQYRHITLPFLFLTDGWFLRTRAGITIAGDNLTIKSNVYARRIF